MLLPMQYTRAWMSLPLASAAGDEAAVRALSPRRACCMQRLGAAAGAAATAEGAESTGACNRHAGSRDGELCSCLQVRATGLGRAGAVHSCALLLLLIETDVLTATQCGCTQGAACTAAGVGPAARLARTAERPEIEARIFRLLLLLQARLPDNSAQRKSNSRCGFLTQFAVLQWDAVLRQASEAGFRALQLPLSFRQY